jgi:hypothetical protein
VALPEEELEESERRFASIGEQYIPLFPLLKISVILLVVCQQYVQKDWSNLCPIAEHRNR